MSTTLDRNDSLTSKETTSEAGATALGDLSNHIGVDDNGRALSAKSGNVGDGNALFAVSSVRQDDGVAEGRLSPPAESLEDKNEDTERQSFHPDSINTDAGAVVPGMEEVQTVQLDGKSDQNAVDPYADQEIAGQPSQDISENAEQVLDPPSQESPIPTNTLLRPPTPSSRTSTPPLTAPAKKFSSINVNKKFLNKTIGSASGYPATLTKLGGPNGMSS